MNFKKILTVSSIAALSVGLVINLNNQTTDAKTKSAQKLSSYSLMTKAAGTKNYAVWRTVRNGKVSGKVANAIDFRYNHIQSNQSIKTKKYTYWLIYVDGRRVGWVNQRYFARNTISVAPNVSLVNNKYDTYDPEEAINYATDNTGTVVDNDKVKISKKYIDTAEAGTTKVKYTFGSGKAVSKVVVRDSASEGIADANAVEAKEGTNKLPSWNHHYGASLNYLGPHDFVPEKKTHTWKSGDLTLKTRLFQPVLLSVKTDTNADGNINRVGHIPEGVTVSNGWAYTSLLSHTNLTNGHIAGYNLNKLKDPIAPQNILTMKQKKFNSYIKNIKVSPYIPVGHGQAMGSTKKYIYVLNYNSSRIGSTDSEEVIQIRRSDMMMNKIWSFKIWNGGEKSTRYCKNGVIVSDNQMYLIYYNKQDDRYEYWQVDRDGDTWTPKIVGATKSTFVTGAPIQGFAYDRENQNFYIGYNDLIVKLSREGDIKKAYTFKTGREIEGLSIWNNKLYTNLAQRAELLESNNLN